MDRRTLPPQPTLSKPTLSPLEYNMCNVLGTPASRLGEAGRSKWGATGDEGNLIQRILETCDSLVRVNHALSMNNRKVLSIL